MGSYLTSPANVESAEYVVRFTVGKIFCKGCSTKVKGKYLGNLRPKRYCLACYIDTHQVKTSKSFVDTPMGDTLRIKECIKTRSTWNYPNIVVSSSDSIRDTAPCISYRENTCMDSPGLVSAYSLNIEREPEVNNWSNKRPLSMQDVSQIDIVPLSKTKSNPYLDVSRLNQFELLSASSNSSSDEENFADGFDYMKKESNSEAGEEIKEENTASSISRIMKDKYLQGFARYILDSSQVRKSCFILDKDPASFYIFQSKISRSRPKIFKVKHIETFSEIAIKELRASTEKDDLKALIEIELWHMSQHTNILPLLEAYKFSSKYYLAYPPPKCSLSDLITHKVQIDENAILIIAYQILCGLDHLHSLQIINRCIRCDSVFIDNDGIVTIGNFSYANKLLERGRTSVVGTPNFMAPEIVRGKPYDNKVDIWAVGIIILTLAEGESPYANNVPMNVLYKISNAPPPNLKDYAKWSKHFHKLLKDCLIKEPDLRKTSKELLQHKAFLNLTERDRLRFKEMVINLT